MSQPQSPARVPEHIELQSNLRLSLAASADSPASRLAMIQPAYLRHPHIDAPDATLTVAEEAVLLATMAGAPNPLGETPEIPPGAYVKGGHAVAVDGSIVPVRALELHRTRDRAGAKAHLEDPARWLLRVPDLLLRRLDAPVAEGLRSWLGRRDAPEADPLTLAEAGATPAVRRSGVAILIDSDLQHIEQHGFNRDRRSEVEVLLGALLDDAAGKPSAGARLDHQVRRHLSRFLSTAPEDSVVAGPEDAMVARVALALTNGPVGGEDLATLAERLRFHADLAQLPADAPSGFTLEPGVRVDTLEALHLVRRSPRPPPRELIDRLKECVHSIDDVNEAPTARRPPRAEIAVAAAVAAGDRGAWLGTIRASTRTRLLAWVALDATALADLSGALYSERTSLSEEDRALLADGFRRLGPEKREDRLLIGVAALGALTEAEQLACVSEVLLTSDGWRLGLYRRLAEDSAYTSVVDAVSAAVLALVTDPAARTLNGPAAALLLALVREGKLPATYEATVLAALSPAMLRHPRVAEELNRRKRA